jgi:hypothetical protein
MFSYLYHLVQKSGLTGLTLHLAAAAVIALSITLSVILVGCIINAFERLEMRFLGKVVKPRTACCICNYFTFIGIAVHEFSHALMAWATGAKVIKIRIFEITSSGRLGHVEFKTIGPKWKRLCQLSLISCAPVLSGTLISYILIRVVTRHTLSTLWTIFLWYLIISILNHTSMSLVDIKNYAKGLFIIFPMMFVISWFLIYFVIS